MYTGRVLPLPFIQPCEPSSRDRLPKGDGWIYEVKFDGYRLQVHKTGGNGHLHCSEPFTNGLSLFAECEERGLEGVVAKHINSIYRSGPSSAWIKVKCPTWREANKNGADVFKKHRS
jgi:ATP-dependent DNA ligase